MKFLFLNLTESKILIIIIINNIIMIKMIMYISHEMISIKKSVKSLEFFRVKILSIINVNVLALKLDLNI